jgi:hypothetical protein
MQMSITRTFNIDMQTDLYNGVRIIDVVSLSVESMAASVASGKKKITQNDLRRIMNEQRRKFSDTVKKIESPLAKYPFYHHNVCRLCVVRYIVISGIRFTVCVCAYIVLTGVFLSGFMCSLRKVVWLFEVAFLL